MRILIFNWRDIRNPDAGGAEAFTHENAKRWVLAGNEVTQFSAQFPGGLPEETVDGVRIVRAGGKYSVYLKAKEYYLNRFSREGFDAIVDEINTVPFFTPAYVREKIVVLIHQLAREFWFYETPLPVAILGRYFLEEHWLRRYMRVPAMTVSNSTKTNLEALGFRDISVVPEGIRFRPLAKVPEKEKEPTFIFVGRLKKAKKPADAIKAFNIFRRYARSSNLWVVGDGYHRRDLERMAGEGVTFFGRVPEEKKLELMGRAHAILVPGMREGWGLIVTEANACGTPAIAYDVPGLRDSCEDFKNGILVGPRPEKMAEIMTNFISNNELRDDLSAGALEHSRQFSWDKSAKETLKVLEDVVYGSK